MASGAMRAAAKITGVGISNVAVRGLPENFTASKVFRPSASILSSATVVDDSSRKLEIAAASTQPIAWELDDWDLAGYDVEEKPRLVFGPAPSLDETKEATTELTDALDMMYLTPSNPVSNCVLDQDSVVPSAPNHALEAFKLLRENSAAQTVVASIAADPNVWNAVLQNEAVKEYMQSEKKFMEAEVQEESQNESVYSNSSNVSDARYSGTLLTNITEKVKLAVAGWLNNISALFNELFEDNTYSKTLPGPANWSSSSTSVCGTFFALASMVIMVVVLKRG